MECLGQPWEAKVPELGKCTRARQNKTSEIDTTAKVLEMILEQLQSMGGLQQERRVTSSQSRAPRWDLPSVDGARLDHCVKQ